MGSVVNPQVDMKSDLRVDDARTTPRG